MPECDLCGDHGLTLEPFATGAEFCTCEAGTELSDRVHEHHHKGLTGCGAPMSQEWRCGDGFLICTNCEAKL